MRASTRVFKKQSEYHKVGGTLLGCDDSRAGKSVPSCRGSVVWVGDWKSLKIWVP